MIRLLVTDLDGTLLDDKGQVSQANRDSIASLAKMGIPTIAATARSPRSTKRISQVAGLGPYAICANGAVVFDLEASEIVSHDFISATTAVEVTAILRRELNGAILAGELLEEFYAEGGFFTRPLPGLDIPPISRLEDHIGAGITKIIARVAGATSEQLRDRLVPLLSELVDITISGPDWIEFAAHGVSKASGIARICELMAVEVSEVAAIGDQRNDLTMLAMVGHPLTLANAHPDLFAFAGAVFSPSNESGFAEVLPYVEKVLAGAPS